VEGPKADKRAKGVARGVAVLIMPVDDEVSLSSWGITQGWGLAFRCSPRLRRIRAGEDKITLGAHAAEGKVVVLAKRLKPA